MYSRITQLRTRTKIFLLYLFNICKHKILANKNKQHYLSKQYIKKEQNKHIHTEAIISYDLIARTNKHGISIFLLIYAKIIDKKQDKSI